MTYTINLYDLPKISLNKWYSGIYWAQRKKIKDNMKWIVRSQTNFSFTKPCRVRYDFLWAARPLDASNCAGGMVKLLEDILFQDDSYKIVKELIVTSNKSNDKKDKVTITIEEQ